MKQLQKRGEVLLDIKVEKPAEEKIVVEDYSNLNLKELVAKFEEKLEIFKADVTKNNLLALTILKTNINTKIKGEEDLEKRSKLVNAFANVNQYIDTLNTQMTSVGPQIIQQFLGTYVSQIESALLQVNILLK